MSRRWRTIHWVALLFSTLLAQGLAATERIPLDISDENQVLNLHLKHYTLTDYKLGEPAAQGRQYLVIRGTLTNKNGAKGVDVPPAQKAFQLRLNGEETLELDPLSEDTADPFWGPMVLQPGEQYPVEMVFSVPRQGLETAEIRHLSNMGAIKLYVVGTAPAERTEFLAGPVSLGEVRLAVGGMETMQNHNGRSARPGYQFVHVEFWYTNLRELQPLETNVASLSALVEDGYYDYHSETLPRPGDALPAEFYAAGEPTAGELVFEIPVDHGHLELVHYTPSGPLRLTLTPGTEKPPLPQIIAGPTRQGRVEISLFASRVTKEGVVLDVGLRLNMDNPMADMSLDLSRAFELHQPSGQFVNSTPDLNDINHPIGEVVLRRDQLVRGQLGFAGVSTGPGQVLLLPLASGPVRLELGGREKQASANTQVATPSDPPRTQNRTAPRTRQRSKEVRAAAPQTKVVTGFPEVLDTGTLSVNWKILHLYGVRGENEPYRSELEGYIGDRPVSCEPVKTNFHKCQINDVDLSELVLRNGAARALPDAPANLQAAERQARDQGVGVWE